MSTIAQPNSTSETPECGQDVAKQNVLGQHQKPGCEAKRSISQSNSRYWEARLFRPFYTRDGQRYEVNDLAVRIQHGERRETFRLHSTSRETAASSAKEIFGFLKANGWIATLAKYKPDSNPLPKVNVTIGDFLQAVRAGAVPSPLRLPTFANYQNCLRTIASEVFAVKSDNTRFDYRNGGNAAWVEKIDGVRLERMTPDTVNEWKQKRLLLAGNSHTVVASAKRTINSYIRCARCLFSPPLLKHVKGLQLPAVLPFAGVELEDNGKTTYVSKVNARSLIADARKELKRKKPEAYKVFLLGLFAGMRKAEIDSAEWGILDFQKNEIKLQQTEWLHLKTADSADDITVDAQLMAELRRFKRSAAGPFIISSDRPPRNDTKRRYYRCEPVFEELNDWLRTKGVTANKPLHEMRKEIGALISTEHGIYAASRFLRHSDITTTARHYAQHKTRISVGLGQLLSTNSRKARTKARKVA